FRASIDFGTIIRIDANFANGIILWKLTRRDGVRHTENVGAEYCPGSAGVYGLENTLATHGEGTVMESAGAGVDSVMIIRIDHDGVDGCGGNKRIVCDDCPSGRSAAAISR